MSGGPACPRRPLFAASLALVLMAPMSAGADSVPTIATNEINKPTPKELWLRQIVKRIEDRKLSPPKALTTQVRAELSFVVGHDGRLISKSILTSSGVPAVDKVAMEMLDRAAPFPPMPAAMTEESLPFRLPLRFQPTARRPAVVAKPHGTP